LVFVHELGHVLGLEDACGTGHVGSPRARKAAIAGRSPCAAAEISKPSSRSGNTRNWQRRSLEALRRLAMGLVTIES
jgi:hypothetical protein